MKRVFALACVFFSMACSDAQEVIDAGDVPDAATDDVAATTCADGLTACGSECVDLTKSLDHCGACENVCPSGPTNAKRACTASKCSATCSLPARLCTAKQSCEVENASSCGTACTKCPVPASGHGSATCNDSACGIQCDSGYGPCQGGCCATHVVDVALGEIHACTLDVLGNVKCWGDDLNGQTGDSATFFSNGPLHKTTTPFLVPLAAAATMIGAASDRSCAVLSTGAMMCWGYSGDGGLGDPNAFNTATPVTVKGNVTSPTSIALGQTHTCAVVSGGVKCWGTNDHGQIGNNGATNTKYTTPVDVVGITNAVAVAAGHYHTCALLSTGAVKCWGALSALGNTSATKDALAPVDVTGLTGAASISASWGHTCVTTTTGGVACWGANYDGELGSGSTTPNTSEAYVTVANLGGTATAVRAGYAISCALLSGGTMTCWGSNGYGEIGDGTNKQRLSPTSNGLTSLVSLSTSWNVTCSVASDGTTRCSGYGDDVTESATNVLTPAVVKGLP
jgi:hypothetical protein